VLDVYDQSFKIHYWEGSFQKPWEPLFLDKSRRQPKKTWTQDLPKSCVLLAEFHLDEQSKLQTGTKQYLRKEYKRLAGTN
jgi:hypothetical protein